MWRAASGQRRGPGRIGVRAAVFTRGRMMRARRAPQSREAPVWGHAPLYHAGAARARRELPAGMRLPVLATAAAPPGLPTAYDSTFGATMVGGLVTTVLYGIFLVQMSMYLQRSRDEMVALKVSIWLLWLLNTMHLICIAHSLYFYMVTNFANPLVLAQTAPWSLPLVVFFTTTTDCLVQTWFIFRVWRLSKENRPLTIALGICSTAALGISLGITIRFYMLKDFAHYSEANWLVYLGLGLTVLTDLLIAVALCYYLRRMRSTVRRTSSMVNALIVYAVNTGLFTSLLCIGCLIARLSQPSNFIFIGLFFPLSSLYANALLGSLNARDWFRSTRDVLSIPLGSLASSGARARADASGSSKASDAQGHAAHLSVQVSTDVVKAAL
ncbi:hypothetical protein PsYK624_052330 [Phanerochaete sordida]|uniref:DUF6534 domain-containing protein n=1 Tax=Phanerochaete sordida TaxID=48140 RepID=A0A9P3LC28_9APHY|nr:hypothetical protein PsYK624_052330 [Phanerochaete sordida]